MDGTSIGKTAEIIGGGAQGLSGNRNAFFDNAAFKDIISSLGTDGPQAFLSRGGVLGYTPSFSQDQAPSSSR